MQDDRRLVRRMQEGDRRAFEEFIDSYGARVHRLVRRYVDNASDAEDVTQEVFVDLYRGIARFRGEAALSTWVYRIAVNHCLRHRQRKQPDSVPFDEACALHDEDWTRDPAASAARRELSDRVQTALDALTPHHRDVVVLHELHGLTYQECASVLNVPVGTVKSRLSNAFRRLRSGLGSYVIGDTAGLKADAIGEVSR